MGLGDDVLGLIEPDRLYAVGVLSRAVRHRMRRRIIGGHSDYRCISRWDIIRDSRQSRRRRLPADFFLGCGCGFLPPFLALIFAFVRFWLRRQFVVKLPTLPVRIHVLYYTLALYFLAML